MRAGVHQKRVTVRVRARHLCRADGAARAAAIFDNDALPHAAAHCIGKGPAKWKLSEVEYVDPMDGKRYKLNAEGFKNRVDFIMTKAKAREILDRQMMAVR